MAAIMLSNAFSLNMLNMAETKHTRLDLRIISVEQARELLLTCGFVSTVGHADAAALFSAQLGFPVEFNRSNTKIEPGIPLIVGQYAGPRLPEGTKQLPENAQLNWWLIEQFCLCH